MMNYLTIIGLFTGLCWSWQVQACHTPERAAKLTQARGDAQFLKAAHAMRQTQKIAYRLLAPSSCNNGFADIFPCKNITLLAHLDLDEIGGTAGTTGNDSWGWKDASENRYYALIGRSNGTAFVDISDPANPSYQANLPSQSGTSDWRDIKTYLDHAFIVADDVTGHGMQVFDLKRLRNSNSAPATFAADAVYDQFDEAHNIAINTDSGYAYAVGSNTCNGGLHMIDIRDPVKPSFAGCYSSDGYTHDVQCINYNGPDSDYQGQEICFASNEDTLTIIDVTEKSSPQQLSRTGYGAHYSHQGWLTSDRRYFLMDDELDEYQNGGNTRTLVWDVSDLDQPVMVGTHLGSGSSIDHNQYIIGNYSYQANYSRGLRVLHLDNLASAQLTEVAYMDSYPEADGHRNWNGAWNVYPFFDNGLVLISDINRGLFIVRPQLPILFDGFETDSTTLE